MAGGFEPLKAMRSAPMHALGLRLGEAVRHSLSHAGL